MMAVYRSAAASAALTQSPFAVFPSRHLTCALAALDKGSRPEPAISTHVSKIRRMSFS